MAQALCGPMSILLWVAVPLLIVAVCLLKKLSLMLWLALLYTQSVLFSSLITCSSLRPSSRPLFPQPFLEAFGLRIMSSPSVCLLELLIFIVLLVSEYVDLLPSSVHLLPQ